MRCVSAARPAAQVKVSNDHSRAFVWPPKPAQRAIGRKKSKPPSSAIFAAATLSGQVAFQRSGTVVSASPPSALVEKTPSLKRFGPRRGCVTSRLSLDDDRPSTRAKRSISREACCSGRARRAGTRCPWRGRAASSGAAHTCGRRGCRCRPRPSRRRCACGVKPGMLKQMVGTRSDSRAASLMP